jgi:lysophospholipase L1-like esterase
MNRKRKRILVASTAIIIIALSLVVVFSENFASNKAVKSNLARIACLGDSITQITPYPMDLQTMLGNNSVVGDFGVSGSTVDFDTSKPYLSQAAFKQAESFLPTTVIIMLGTNDARTDNYKQINTFVADYETMISRIQAFSSKPRIFIVEPPPIYNNSLNLNGTSFAQGVIPRIQQVANALNLPLINVYTPLLNHPEYFPDGVHPNSEGAQVIANIIYNAIESSSS